jgi:hypothetical protein
MMNSTNMIWKHFPVDRASTPIPNDCVFNGPRTSTPKTIRRRKSIHRNEKKKRNNDYRLLFYGQKANTHRKRHFQIWFL